MIEIYKNFIILGSINMIGPKIAAKINPRMDKFSLSFFLAYYETKNPATSPD